MVYGMISKAIGSKSALLLTFIDRETNTLSPIFAKNEIPPGRKCYTSPGRHFRGDPESEKKFV